MRKILLSYLMGVGLSVQAQTIPFNLQGQVFDDGQKIVAVELQTAALNLDKKDLNKAQFKVYAKGSLPIDVGENKTFGVFDETERRITDLTLTPQGNIRLGLDHNPKAEGANRLAYVAGEVNRNLALDLTYRIESRAKNLPETTAYQQQAIIDLELDRYTAKVSAQQIPYQFYAPKTKGKHPLIIWFHGNGEGGYQTHQNNQSQLLANRGGATFVNHNTQAIFGDAYVIAPQAPDTWYNNYSKDYISKIKTLIDHEVANNAIDPNRIYIFGASAGGYMGLRMLIEYPDFFAAANLSAPALDRAIQMGGKETTEADLAKIQAKPLWLVHAVNDPTIAYTDTTKRVFMQLREYGAIMSVYPEVKVGESTYNGHWSWIYSLNNQPVNPQGETLFEWMAKQKLR